MAVAELPVQGPRGGGECPVVSSVMPQSSCFRGMNMTVFSLLTSMALPRISAFCSILGTTQYLQIRCCLLSWPELTLLFATRNLKQNLGECITLQFAVEDVKPF